MYMYRWPKVITMSCLIFCGAYTIKMISRIRYNHAEGRNYIQMCYSVKILVQTFVIADKNQQERNIDHGCTKKNKKQHIWYKFLYTLGRQKRNLIWNNFCPVGFSGAHRRKCPPLVVFSVENTRECLPSSLHILTRAYIKILTSFGF